MSIWWSLQLRRDASSVPLARRLLRGAMDTAGVDADVSHDLSLALTEACSNAVRHAAGASEMFRVTASIDGDVCHIEVIDSGPGFPPAAEPPGEPDTDASPGGVPDPLAIGDGKLDSDPFRVPEQEAREDPGQRESGRGLSLIAALSDHVRFDNRSLTGGAVVSFDKVLKWREDSLLHV
ncbi:ATP-binding protein [Streptomyces sp. ST2-7A]|uniref:ATP-binding protein n=1 Tax=Streptomyces sp. ST2-7A TaxID=2907214 RepID=UPI001F21CE01|nr:ATP-binding protein [Streptomyces sp. ST2-7A]MCE7083394.1 ATP-binding protein [Streptomyces sp. ST2-7A]